MTAAGKKQAAAWGQILARFAWDRILASDAVRALATVEIINAILKIPLVTDLRLKEQNWGLWEGKTVRQLEADARQVLEEQVDAGWDFCPPGGESRRRVLKRSQQAILEAAGRYPGQTILVVSHEGVIKSLIYHLCGRKFLPGEPAILKSYQLHWLVCGPGGLQIEEINAIALMP